MKRKRPRLIGVLNLSPESTVPGSVATTPDTVLRRAETLHRNGADIIEIGARSITVQAPLRSEEEELRRLQPALEQLKARGYSVAVETWSEATAAIMVRDGADMINFSGGFPAGDVYRAAGRAGVPVVVLYLPYHDPYTMRTTPCVRYGTQQICDVLLDRAGLALDCDCPDVVVDPNLGIFHPEIDVYEKIIYQLQALQTIPALQAGGLRVLAYCPRKESLTSRVIMAGLLLELEVDYIRIHEPEMIERLLCYE